ncbi:MAG: DUF481 domain-containing protein [Gemmatimonadota bacterium]|nr:DUF481 domain-containing protein [Gemmatimonadota bacterium]
MSSRIASMIVAGLACVGAPAAAQEYLIHRNGDRIQGEIKGLQRGKLRFEIPGSGTFSVDWPEVAGLESPEVFEVERDDTLRFFGTLRQSSEAGALDVVSPLGTVTIPLERVIALEDIATGFWSRLDGFIEFGFSFAKANEAVNYSLQGTADYRTRHDIVALSASSFLQGQQDAETTTRTNIQLTYTRLLRRGWSLSGLSFAETNEELDLDLRWAAGAAGGRDFVQSASLRFNASTGLLFNAETFTDVETQRSLEGLVHMRFEWFTFASNETDLTANVMVLPSFTEWGRVRIDGDIKLQQDFLGDFYVSLSFYDQYDSAPPTEAGATNDYGTTLALGWDP